ncbi:penicillin-binding protein 1C [Ancylobacter sp. 3268]|uniref:penicillin-binding protein 1C n=1 Tax=Ancylobacter sp. 3268 TaxID=2817752 RepID=UPI00285A3183|nr:penicillin-binding protein 1C [Ancylobacter sp. 3268]MDR6954265.1 penicillin-binding protein 1C [Ancylobacter sp. 3268]
MSENPRPLWQLCLAGGLLAGVISVGGSYAWLAGVRAAAPPFPAIATSVEVLDRDGRLLRPFALPDGRWRLAADPSLVDRRYIDMLIAYEDKRFYDHAGVDPWALLRAAWQFVTHGRVVSGGSTLTMQVARLLEPRPERTLRAKLAEMRRAIELEARFSKAEILKLYMTLAPFGGNLEGVRAASLSYFGKEPRRLSLAEAALLVALPQAPEARRPDRQAAAAGSGRRRVIERIEKAGLFGGPEARFALAADLPERRRELPSLAFHAAETARRERPASPVHRLAIDAAAQERLETLAAERAATLEPGVSLAMAVIDNASGEVLARVSGSDRQDRARAGAVDLTRALRSPGSTLKPLIYGMAFEDGLVHPETLIEDRPMRFGAYRPRNFDLDYQGVVSVKRALQMSLNMPAVALLQAVGPQRLASRLNAAGIELRLPPGEVPGLAVGLGGAGVTLEGLAALYAAIGNGGVAHSPRRRLDDRVMQQDIQGRRILTPVASWYLTQSLSGAPPPRNVRGGLIAFKTGTSFGYRDAWSVGLDGRRTVAVWIGRPDGQPVPGMIGREKAAPLLFEAFARLSSRPAPLPTPPRDALVVRNGELPPPLRRFRDGDAPVGTATGPHIAFPPPGATLDIEPSNSVALKARGGEGLHVLIDGMPAGTTDAAGVFLWQPAREGFIRLTVMDAAGLSDSVSIRLRMGR